MLCGGTQCPTSSSCVDDECVCDEGYWPSTDEAICVPVDLSTGLVTHYPFNGDTKDVSGQGHDCSANGPTPAADRFDQANKAFAFDGVDDYLHCGVGGAWQTFGTATWTFSAWIKITGDGDAAQTILNGIYHRPWITVNNYSHVHLAYMDSTGTYTPSASTQIGAIVPNQWMHVVVVADGSKYIQYVDGLESGNLEWGAIQLDGVDHYRIGNTPNGEENFKGHIDEIMFFDRALSAEEVNALWALTSSTD